MSGFDQEREMRDVKDIQLLRRMLSYAVPHWKMILLCIMMTFMVVASNLARPYIIKVAIDTYINGVYQPMVQAPASHEKELDKFGRPFDVNGYSYVRVTDSGRDISLAADMNKREIIDIGGQRYLVKGWIPAQHKQIHAQTAQGTVRLVVDGRSYQAQTLSHAQFSAFHHRDYRGLLVLGSVFLAVVIAASILNYLQTNLLQITGQQIIYYLREQIFKHLSRMSMSFFDHNPVGRLVIRVTQDTESLNQLYSQVVVNLIRDLITVIGIIVVMMQLSMKLSLVCFAVLPLLVLVTAWYKKEAREAQRNRRLILSRLNAFLAENLSGMRITQFFVREQKQKEDFDSFNSDYYHAGMRNTVVNSIFQPAIGLLGNLSVALLIWFGGRNVISGAITFGVVYAFTHYIREFFQPLMSLAGNYNTIQTAMVGAERIFDMLDEKQDITDAPNPKSLPDRVQGRIVFDHVWFAYEGEDWVLRDVNFTIEPGQTIAFVGATGAGKSSIIQLINRFYDVTKGRILLDGVDIREIALHQLRMAISVVHQDVFMFIGDIKDNIRLNNETVTDAEVKEAARMVHLDEFIENLPQKYDTPLGERGINLSLGQRQLLSFARSIVFRPQILILDEATANIDTETEIAVQDALAKISKDRTTLIVAHRLSTIQHADQIIVMQKGEVREIGNHYRLLSNRDYYYNLYEMQYKDRGKGHPESRTS